MTEKKEAYIVAITRKISGSNSFSIVLETKNDVNRVSIPIGESEAQSIAIALEGIKSKRPLTHDLIVNILEKKYLNVEYVYIYKFTDNIYHCKIETIDVLNEKMHFDARVSDAIAIAIRVKCPIYLNPKIMGQTNEDILKKENTTTKVKAKTNTEFVSTLTDQTLQQKLAESIEKEDYLYAALIRDEINRRK